MAAGTGEDARHHVADRGRQPSTATDSVPQRASRCASRTPQLLSPTAYFAVGCLLATLLLLALGNGQMRRVVTQAPGSSECRVDASHEGRLFSPRRRRTSSDDVGSQRREEEAGAGGRRDCLVIAVGSYSAEPTGAEMQPPTAFDLSGDRLNVRRPTAPPKTATDDSSRTRRTIGDDTTPHFADEGASARSRGVLRGNNDDEDNDVQRQRRAVVDGSPRRTIGDNTARSRGAHRGNNDVLTNRSTSMPPVVFLRGATKEADLAFLSLPRLPVASALGSWPSVGKDKKTTTTASLAAPFFRAAEDPSRLLFVAGPFCVFNGSLFADYEYDSPGLSRLLVSAGISPPVTLSLSPGASKAVAFNDGRVAHAFFPLSQLRDAVRHDNVTTAALEAEEEAHRIGGSVAVDTGGGEVAGGLLAYLHEDDTHHLYHTFVDFAVPLLSFFIRHQRQHQPQRGTALWPASSLRDSRTGGSLRPLLLESGRIIGLFDGNRYRPSRSLYPEGVPHRPAIHDRFGPFLDLLSGVFGPSRLTQRALHIRSNLEGGQTNTIPNPRCFRGALVGTPTRTLTSDSLFHRAAQMTVASTVQFTLNLSVVSNAATLDESHWWTSPAYRSIVRQAATTVWRSRRRPMRTPTTHDPATRGGTAIGLRPLRVTIISRRTTRSFGQAEELRDALLDQSNQTAAAIFNLRDGTETRREETEGDATLPSPWFDVTIATLEALSFTEQLVLAMSTDILVGVHGMGLTWICFMPPHGGIVELNGWHVAMKDYKRLAEGCARKWVRVLAVDVDFVSAAPSSSVSTTTRNLSNATATNHIEQRTPFMDWPLVNETVRAALKHAMLSHVPHERKEFWLQRPRYDLAQVMTAIAFLRSSMVNAQREGQVDPSTVS